MLSFRTVDFIDDALRCLAAFSGGAAENMTRNFAWRFLDLGRRLERGIEVARAVGSFAGTAHDREPSWLLALLELCDSFMTYRSRYMIVPIAAPALDLLVLDETNPRSLSYQLAALDRIFADLPREGPYRTPAHRLTLALLTDLRMLDAIDLDQVDDKGGRPALQALLERSMGDLRTASDQIGRTYFAHTEGAMRTTSYARREPLP